MAADGKRKAAVAEAQHAKRPAAKSSPKAAAKRLASPKAAPKKIATRNGLGSSQLRKKPSAKSSPKAAAKRAAFPKAAPKKFARRNGYGEKITLATRKQPTVLTACGDHTAKVWSIETGKCLLTLRGHTHEVSSASYFANGTRILTSSWDATARVWDSSTGVCKLCLPVCPNVWYRDHGCVSAVASNDGSRLLTAAEHVATVWDAASGERMQDLDHGGKVWSAVFNADGSHIISCGAGLVNIWTADGGLARSLQIPEAEIATFCPDGQICVGCGDGAIHVGDWRQDLKELKKHNGQVCSVTVSGDGTELLVTCASEDHAPELWDVETGACLQTFFGHTDIVHAAAFSADDTQVVTASDDGSAKLWDRQTGECLLTFGHECSVHTAVLGEF